MIVLPKVRFSRSLLPALLLAGCVWAQKDPPAIAIPNRMVFRVVTENKVDSHKTKSGDKVKMTLLDAEDLDDGTNIPAGAILEGRVLEAVPYVSAAQPARLMVIMEKLSWKKHSVPISAFIIGQGKLKTKNEVGFNSRCNDPFVHGDAVTEAMCKLNKGNQTATVNVSTSTMQDVKLMQTGTPPYPILVCYQHNIVIENNMALLVRNLTAH